MYCNTTAQKEVLYLKSLFAIIPLCCIVLFGTIWVSVSASKVDDTVSTSTEESTSTASTVETVMTTTTIASTTTSTSTTTAVTTTTTATTTTPAVKETVTAENVTVGTISVSCLKIEWDETDYLFSIQVDTEAPYPENIYTIEKKNNLFYLTGLRENSEYQITITPKIESDDWHEVIPVTVTGKTETVNVIQDFDEFEYNEEAHLICDEEGNQMYDEEGNPLIQEYVYNPSYCYTACMAYEEASGLTRQPSSGAIYGSVPDVVTGTNIRRDEYGDYCVAMGTYFGYCWDRFLIEFDNGQQITVKICDSKGDRAYHPFGSWGHCVLEMIHDGISPPSGVVTFTGNYASCFWNGLKFGNIVSVKKIDYPENPVTY